MGIPKKISDFYDSEYCHIKRSFEDLSIVTNKDYRYDKAIAVKAIIHGILHGDYQKDDIGELLDQAIMDYNGETSETSRLRKEELSNYIIRYINSEKKRVYVGDINEKKVSVGDYDISIKPDEVFDEAGVIQCVIYKQGRCYLPITKVPDDPPIELLLMLQYAKSLVPEGKTRTCKASFYYLKQKTESGVNPSSQNFFEEKGANVVTISDVYTNTPHANPTDYDLMLQNKVEEYSVGKEACTEEECKTCYLNGVCSYSPEPVQREIKEVKGKAPVTPSDAQSQIINFKKGICRVLAGAGAGKTECVASRFVALITDMINSGMEANAAAKKILLITFTEAGCNEMRQRVLGKLKTLGIIIDADSIIARTFNAFAFDIIRDKYEDLGFTAPPNVVDNIRNRVIIADLLNTTIVPDINYLYFTQRSKNCKGGLAIAEDFFDNLKAEGKEPDDVNGTYARTYASLRGLYGDYCAALINENLVTYADQEPMMLKVLEKYPKYLDSLGFKHVIVDEFQDSNDVQMKTIRLLTETSCFESLMVVGDDSQSIFSFRHTSPENIIHFFDKLGKTGTDLYLTENYRSTPQIIDLANKINDLNQEKVEKDLVSMRPDSLKPFVRGFLSKKEEYEYIAETMRKLIEERNWEPEDIAFIAATKAELVALSKVLDSKHLPYVMLNPITLSENSRIKSAISLSKAFYQPEATENYLNYLVSVHGAEFEEIPHEKISEEISKMQEVFTGIDGLEIPVQREIFHKYLEDIKGTDEIFSYFLELLYANPDFQSELSYLSNFVTFGDDEAKKMSALYNGIALVTAHSSKGLEWRVVFNSVDNYDSEYVHHRSSVIEEKRRLLFVSVTRARDLLFVTGQFICYGAKNDRTYNMFLRETYDCLGRKTEYESSLRNISAQEAEREAALKAERAERAKKRRAAKKELGNLAGFTNNLPGQNTFAV